MSNTGPHATRVFAISELVRSNASIERSTERSEYSTGGLSLSSREEEEALASSASAPKASSNACVASCAKTRKEWLCASAHGVTATRTFLAVSRESSTLFRKEALLEKDLSFLDRTTWPAATRIHCVEQNVSMGKQSENKQKRTDDATAGLTSAERSAGIATSLITLGTDLAANVKKTSA